MRKGPQTFNFIFYKNLNPGQRSPRGRPPFCLVKTTFSLGSCCKNAKLHSRAGRERNFFGLLAQRGNAIFDFCNTSLARVSFLKRALVREVSQIAEVGSPRSVRSTKNNASRPAALRGNAIFAFCDTSAAGVPILGGVLAENARRGSTP